MATETLSVTPDPVVPTDELRNGDRLSQPEFHALYERMPPSFRAELIGGVVYVPSPLKRDHGVFTHTLSGLLFHYRVGTPGIEVVENATVILGTKDEPQPDVVMRVRPDHGGRSRTTTDDYIAGPPECLFEVAHSSRSIDLNKKKKRYLKTGVLEYLVLNLRDRRMHWFDLTVDQILAADADGIIRVRTFPGLWIHVDALIRQDLNQLLATLNQGLTTPEHAVFVAKLAAAKQG